jgi:hypothetical protein
MLRSANYKVDSPMLSSQASIDKDNDLIERLLLAGQFDEAHRVFEVGAFSRPYAQLSLGSQGLPEGISIHSSVTGASESGEVIKGSMFENGKRGGHVVRILYQNEDILSSCFVGGNPVPVTDGCKIIVDVTAILA